MIRVVSDIHGCEEKYRALLVRLRPEDTLYILGDVIDRGPGGIAILEDMMERENVIPLWGNHEYLMYRVVRHAGERVTPKEAAELLTLYDLWTEKNGGLVTMEAWHAIPETRKKALLQYLASFRACAEICAGGNRFFLCHTGPRGFQRERPPESYELEDFLEEPPDYGRVYFPDRFLVTGHIPTGRIAESSLGRIFRKNNHIAVDCGTVFGGPLGCFCLDTMEEEYF